MYLLQCRPSQAAYKLRSDHVTQCIDEKRKCQSLDIPRYFDAHLAKSNSYQQRRRHWTEHKRAEAKLAAKITKRHRQCDRRQRRCGKKHVQIILHTFSRRLVDCDSMDGPFLVSVCAYNMKGWGIPLFNCCGVCILAPRAPSP